MASIPEKKAVLSLSDGTSINLNKPIDIPSSVTDITQITEPGWYHGTFTFRIKMSGGGGGSSTTTTITDISTISNTPAIKIKDTLMIETEHNFDMFITKTGDYIFNLGGYLFYGVIQTKDSTTSINWEIVSPLVIDDLTSTSSTKALSANQGKVLNDKIASLTKDDVGLDLVDNTPDEEKDVNNADTAQHLATKNSDGSITGLSVGNESTPVYFGPNGTPQEATNVMPKPIYSSTDLTPGTSDLADGQIYIVYYN